MNILVTGGTGFIGSHLIPLLLKKHKIFLLSRKSSNTWRIKEYLHDIVQLSVEDGVETVFKKYKIHGIIHLATNYQKKDPEAKKFQQMSQDNLLFPAGLIEMANRYKVKFFINTGTCFEYYLANTKISERHPSEAYNYYAATKLAFEQICRYYSNHKGMRVITLKLFYPYGEKDNLKLIPIIIESFLKNKPLKLTAGGQKLDFTHVSDIANAYIRAVTFICSNHYKTYEVFNIGAGSPQTVKNIFTILRNLSKSKKNSVSFTVPYAKNEIMYMKADNKKAMRVLSWSPRVSLEEGLRRTYNYYRSNL